jgi:hypothetical protein
VAAFQAHGDRATVEAVARCLGDAMREGPLRVAELFFTRDARRSASWSISAGNMGRACSGTPAITCAWSANCSVTRRRDAIGGLAANWDCSSHSRCDRHLDRHCAPILTVRLGSIVSGVEVGYLDERNVSG